MRSRSQVIDRQMQQMQSASAEVRELTQRQQALSKLRAEIIAQQGRA